MRIRMRAFVIAIAVACLISPSSTAQEKAPLNSDQLKEQIAKLESAGLDKGSATVKTALENTLRALYADLAVALQRDIDNLKKIREMGGGRNSADLDARIASSQRELSSLPNLSSVNRVDQPAASANDGVRRPTMTSVSEGGKETTSVDGNVDNTRSSTAGDDSPRATEPGATTADFACTDSNKYSDAPELVTARVNDITGTIVRHNDDANQVSAGFVSLFFYTVADAVLTVGDTSDNNIRKLKAYQYLGETARTDKQIGASPKAAGSTSAIEKPGFARLLGIAVERGAILQDVNSTSLTLSTSPYLLATFNNGGDTTENYQRVGFLNRIGLSATFNVANTDSPVLTNARRNQLTQWSTKVRLFGDRSTRGAAFQRFWDTNIEPSIAKRLVAIGNEQQFVNSNQELRDLSQRTRTELRVLVRDRMTKDDYVAARRQGDTVALTKILNDFILCYLKEKIVDQIRSDQVALSADTKKQITDKFVPQLGAALSELQIARKRLDEKLDDLFKSPLATFAYTNYRVPGGSDYSEFKFLYEQDQSIFRILKLVGNAGFSIYNKPNPVLNQSRVRDFSASVSLEGKTNSPFLKDVPDLSKITYAFTGSFERMRENQGVSGKSPNLAAAQFRLEIPITAGVSIPFSLTYSNGTEQQKKNHTRGNFGLSLDTDKLWAITRLLKVQ